MATDSVTRRYQLKTDLVPVGARHDTVNNTRIVTRLPHLPVHAFQSTTFYLQRILPYQPVHLVSRSPTARRLTGGTERRRREN